MWLGLTIVSIFIVLVLLVYSTSCIGWPSLRKEGFQAQASRPIVPAAGPPPATLGDSKIELSREEDLADLPGAPAGYTASDAPVPFQDPKNSKATAAQIYGLTEEMRGFNGFELPGLEQQGDPNITIAISTFRGQFQELIDESRVLNQNPGIASTITQNDLERMRANLRYLQKAYRTYKGVDVKGETKEKKEGFINLGTSDRATLEDLKLVKERITSEIARLTQSGSTDPVLTARIDAMTKLRQMIDTWIGDVTSGTKSVLDIPFTKAEIAKFLPALADTTTTETASSSVIDAIRNFFSGVTDGSGSIVNLVGRAKADKIIDELMRGLSLDVKYSYVGDNAVALAEAEAIKAQAQAGVGTSAGAGEVGGVTETTTQGAVIDGFSRGQYADIIKELDATPAGRPLLPTVKKGGFDWRERAKGICENIRKAGLDPADYGCLSEGAQVGPNYSWRGHAKMVCTRLETNAVAGTATTMGCPPVEWKGWRI